MMQKFSKVLDSAVLAMAVVALLCVGVGCETTGTGDVSDAEVVVIDGESAIAALANEDPKSTETHAFDDSTRRDMPWMPKKKGSTDVVAKVDAGDAEAPSQEIDTAKKVAEEKLKAAEASTLAEAKAAEAEKAKQDVAAMKKADEEKMKSEATKLVATEVGAGVASAVAAVAAVVAAVDSPEYEAGDAREILRVGIAPTYAPVIYRQGSTVFGMEADNARGVAKALDRRLEFMPYANPSKLIEALVADEIDVIMSGLTRTLEREALVRFADSFVKVPLGVLVPAAEKEDYFDGRDVRSARVAIGVKENTTAHEYAQVYCYGGRSEITFVTPQEAPHKVIAGELGFFIADLPSVRFIASAYEEQLDFIDFDLQSQRLAWAVGPDNKKLQKDLNKILKGWRKTGELQENISRWLPTLGEGIEGEDRVGRQPPFTAISIKSDAPLGTMGTIVIDGSKKMTRAIDIGSPNWEMFYLMKGDHTAELSAPGYETSSQTFKAPGRPTWQKLKMAK